MGFQKGQIGVRIRVSEGINADHTVGTMYECLEDGYNFYYTNSTSSSSIRLATEEEIEAFNLGCRHIDDLDQYINREQLLTQIL